MTGTPNQERPQRPPRPGARADFKLKRFPKEFEKSVTSGLDGTYVSILFISLFVLSLSFGILSANAVEFFGLSHAELQARVQKIIQKTYNVETVEDEPEEEEPDEELTEEEEKQEDRKEEIKKRQETKKNEKESVQDRIARRRAEADKRRQQRAAARQRVANSAQLALITGGASSTGEGVTDILGNNSSNIDLDKALTGTDGIAVARNAGARTRAIQGSRNADGVDVSQLTEGVSGVGSTELGSRQSDIGFGELGLNDRSAQSAGRKPSEVSAKIKGIQAAVQNCFRKEKRLNPSLKGTIKVSFNITARGQVRSVKFPTNTLRNTKVTRCISTQFRRLRFDAAKRDVRNVTATYIFQ